MQNAETIKEKLEQAFQENAALNALRTTFKLILEYYSIPSSELEKVDSLVRIAFKSGAVAAVDIVLQKAAAAAGGSTRPN